MSGSWWAFLPLPRYFLQNQNNHKSETDLYNVIDKFNVFRKYITQYHWKWYDVFGAFQHFQLPK